MAEPVGGDGYIDEDKAKIPRTLALVVGIIYTLLGILGFFITGFENFAAET
nr:hypothetical protein [Acidothermales bacterium]